ncbi:MAG: hypothetical protein ACSHX5_03405 [Phycisphaerales bacterium]
MNSMTLKLIVITLLSLMLSPTLASAQNNADGSGLTLEQAIAQLDASIQQAGKLNADEKIREAAATLAYVLEQEGIESADGELTLGNAYFVGGDLGWAILHYRKGLQIDPSHELLRKNLAHARSFVEPSVPENGSDGWVRSSLLAWQHITDRWTMWFAIITLLTLASFSMSLRIIDPNKRIPLKAPISLAVIGFIALGLLSYEQWTAAGQRELVIVTPGTGFYSGPSRSVYQEIYDGPLGIGTEAIELDRRDGWVNIRLSNAQEGWILDEQGAFVNQ